MSSYHIRGIAEDYKTVAVVFHIPVSTGNNAAGLPWCDVLVRYLGGASSINTILPEVVGTVEETNMKAGVIIEKSCVVKFSSLNLTNAQRLEEIVVAYNNIESEETNRLSMILNYFGKEGSVI